MRRGIIFIVAIVVFVGCKKNKDIICGYCPCINNVNDTFPTGNIDSATFYQSLLGTWYLHQFDTSESLEKCTYQCYCDTQYSCIFLANNTFIITLPGDRKDTFAYSFYSNAPNTVNPNSGMFTIPGNPSLICPIIYTSNYLALSKQDLYGTYYAPNYYLTRH